MAFVHGKNTVLTLGGADISAWCRRSNLDETADKSNMTTYGKDRKVWKGGLIDGTMGIEGAYDNTTSGPHDVIRPMLGTNVTLVRKVEGTGSGLPIDTVDVLVEKYTETMPVDDYVAWAVELQFSDTMTTTNQ